MQGYKVANRPGTIREKKQEPTLVLAFFHRAVLRYPRIPLGQTPLALRKVFAKAKTIVIIEGSKANKKAPCGALKKEEPFTSKEKPFTVKVQKNVYFSTFSVNFK